MSSRFNLGPLYVFWNLLMCSKYPVFYISYIVSSLTSDFCLVFILFLLIYIRFLSIDLFRKPLLDLVVPFYLPTNFLFSISFISAPILLFPGGEFGLRCYYFCSSLICKIRWLIWDASHFLIKALTCYEFLFLILVSLHPMCFGVCFFVSLFSMVLMYFKFLCLCHLWKLV